MFVYPFLTLFRPPTSRRPSSDNDSLFYHTRNFIFQRTAVFLGPRFRSYPAEVLSSANAVSNILRSLLHVRCDIIRPQPFLFLCTTLLVFQCTAVFLGLLFRMLSARLLFRTVFIRMFSRLSPALSLVISFAALLITTRCRSFLLSSDLRDSSVLSSLLLFAFEPTHGVPWAFLTCGSYAHSSFNHTHGVPVVFHCEL